MSDELQRRIETERVREIEHNPDSHRGWADRAEAQIRIGEYPEADAWSKRSVELPDAWWGFLEEMADRYFDGDRSSIIVSEIRSALEKEVRYRRTIAHGLDGKDEPPKDPMDPKLWVGAATSPYGNPYGLIAVVAASKAAAVRKARLYLEADNSTYVPHQECRDNLLDQLDNMKPLVERDVVVDWSPSEGRG